MYTPQQRLERAHVWLMSQPSTAAFAGLLMVGKTELSDKVPTAGTDGFNKIYNPTYMAGLSDQELRGLILHENLHIAYRQIYLWKHLATDMRSKMLLNMAMDYVINLEIVDIHPDVKLPEGGCIDEQYRGLDTYQVFQKLQQNSDNGGGGSGEGEGEGFDTHDFDGTEDAGTVEREVDNAIRQGQILAGKLKGNVPRAFGELTTPKIDWRTVLQDFIIDVVQGKDYATWRKPNRRYLHQGIYMPSTEAETIGRLVVAIDTSGSIGNDTLNRFLSELIGIVTSVPPSGIDILYWDTDVARHEIYAPDEYGTIVGKTQAAGGGGTDVNCVTKYMTDNKIDPCAAIIFTDGYLYDGFGQWNCPTLWAIVDNKSCTSPVGVTMHI